MARRGRPKGSKNRHIEYVEHKEAEDRSYWKGFKAGIVYALKGDEDE